MMMREGEREGSLALATSETVMIRDTTLLPWLSLSPRNLVYLRSP